MFVSRGFISDTFCINNAFLFKRSMFASRASKCVCRGGEGIGGRSVFSLRVMETLTWELAHNFVFASLLKWDIHKNENIVPQWRWLVRQAKTEISLPISTV